jgi:lipoate-protein ligase A
LPCNPLETLFTALAVYHDSSPHSAAMNMAIDEALLEHATVPSIRFYGWHPLALSFGYFGKFADVAKYAITRDLVRRWTGGGIVFHGDDLTYSIVFPANDTALNESSMSIYEKVHRALCDALGGGVKGAVVAGSVDPRRSSIARQATDSVGGYDCFANPVRADVMVDSRKIAGAAQRRTRRGLLQQGSIQGVDLENGLAERFAAKLSNNCEARSIPKAVEYRAREIAAQKYGAEAWLRKR